MAGVFRSLRRRWARRMLRALATDSILFLEDIGTKPYQWDRMLLHLRYAGLLEKVTRHCLRRYAAVRCAGGERTIWSARFCMRCATLTGRLRLGLRSGHVDAANITLPLGISVRLDLT